MVGCVSMVGSDQRAGQEPSGFKEDQWHQKRDDLAFLIEGEGRSNDGEEAVEGEKDTGLGTECEKVGCVAGFSVLSLMSTDKLQLVAHPVGASATLGNLLAFSKPQGHVGAPRLLTLEKNGR